jgi:deoxyribose-phosphate aldolase
MARTLARTELARLIDYRLHAGGLPRDMLQRCCEKARAHGLFSVCVQSSLVVPAAHWLDGSEVKVTCVIGYPWGGADADAKRYETEVAIDNGAHLIELAANTGLLRDGDDDARLLREFRDIVEAADERPVSVSIQNDELRRDDLRRACELVVESGAKGITLTADLFPELTVGTVREVRATVGATFGIKVDDADQAIFHTENLVFPTQQVVALLDAGATRFGMTRAAALLERL